MKFKTLSTITEKPKISKEQIGFLVDPELANAFKIEAKNLGVSQAEFFEICFAECLEKLSVMQNRI